MFLKIISQFTLS